LAITSRRVIARTSRAAPAVRCSPWRGLYPTGRTSLNLYALDISNVYDNGLAELSGTFKDVRGINI
jgi:hypothetical protein